MQRESNKMDFVVDADFHLGLIGYAGRVHQLSINQTIYFKIDCNIKCIVIFLFAIRKDCGSSVS